nr:MFS transporter [Paenactinomyces guangxiensis]
MTLLKSLWSTVLKSFQLTKPSGSNPLPRDYIILLSGLLVSRLGDSLNAFAIPWISYQLTGSAIVMGSLFATSVLPIVLFGSVVGVFVDRWDRRKLMLTADITRALLVGLIPILHLLNLLSLWHLYVISFILAVLSLLFDVATISSIPQMAGNDLTRANAGYQLVNQLADLAGPTLAGIIVAAIGGFHTLWLDVFSFTATFLAVFRLPSLGDTHLTDRKNILRNMAKDIVDGFKWLMNDRLNFSLSLQAMVGNFGASAVLAVFMYYLLSTLHLNSEQSGLNYTLIGVGGLIGSMVVIPLDKRFRRGILIPILLGIGAIGLIFAITSRFWLAPGIAFGIATVCNVAWNSLVASVRQETVPSDMLGRVLGFSRVFTRLAMPLGAFVGSFISSINPASVFVLAAVTKGLEVVIALVSPIRKL